MPEALRKRLEHAKDLKNPDDQFPEWSDAIDGFQEVGRTDRGEPSLPALGSLFQEMAFLVARRLLEYEGHMLGLPTSDSVPQFRPLVRHHPYGPSLEFFTKDYKEQGYAGWSIHELDYKEVGFAELPILGYIYGDLHKAEMQTARSVASGHSDLIYRDLLLSHRNGFLVRSNNEQQNRETAAILRSVSPHMPTVIALLVDIDWKADNFDAQKLERDYADEPLVISALADKYVALAQSGNAARCLKQKIRLAPDYRSYRSLAEIYKQTQDMKQWKATLEKSLELPSMGLESTSIRVALADYYMQRREFREALPYADAAAQSYAAWALLTAARCHEMLEDWDKAEALMAATARHTNSSRLNGCSGVTAPVTATSRPPPNSPPLLRVFRAHRSGRQAATNRNLLLPVEGAGEGIRALQRCL